jgi:hypothetical protein
LRVVGKEDADPPFLSNTAQGSHRDRIITRPGSVGRWGVGVH